MPLFAYPKSDGKRYPGAAMTALVGRDAELRGLLDLLAADERLLTLRGPVGVGKSALARAVAQAARESGLFEAIRNVDLSTAISDEAMLDAVGQNSLDEQQLLLVLDGADGVLTYLRHRARSWLASAPELSLLVVAREPIDNDGERLVDLQPLPPSSSDEPVARAPGTRRRPKRSRSCSSSCESSTGCRSASRSPHRGSR